MARPTQAAEETDIYSGDNLQLPFLLIIFPTGTFMMTLCVFHSGPIHYRPSPTSWAEAAGEHRWA